MKKGFTLIEVLAVIVILSVISAIAYPKIIDTISISKITAYNTAKANLIESAKLKFLADVNNSKITEYTIDDLIKSGYVSKDTKNPLTMKDYENTKIIVTNREDDVTFNYVEGDTLYDVIIKQKESDGLYKIGDEYIYKGINSNNYISFSGEIYRILKADNFHNVYLLKDEENALVKKDNIYNYVTSYYNDNYTEIVKNNVITFDVLDYSDYINSVLNNETYIVNNSNIWVKKDNDYKYLSYIDNKIIDSENYGNLRFVLKLKNYLTVTSGDGSQLKPYIVNE